MLKKHHYLPSAMAFCFAATIIAGVNGSSFNGEIAAAAASPRVVHVVKRRVPVRKAQVRNAPKLSKSVRVASKPAKRHWDRRIDALPSRGTYKRMFRVKATAYMPIYEGMEGGRYTCTRKDGRSSHGIAVDPRLIPLGTRLWIPGYGHAVADDVGGAIKGHHIDVRVQERRQMHSWGVRNLRVYVLDEPRRNLN